MKRFVEGLDRGQSTLFPASLDDYVSEDNPVRAVDVFVDGLDLGKLGFVGVPTELSSQHYAHFRKDNSKAIREVCREFVALCRKLDLFSAASVAIDGSKFKAVNARDKNFTEAKMKRRLERIDESIARYLSQLETADRHGDAVPEAKVERLKDKIEKLKEEIVRLNAINAEMMKSEDKQISLTDPDARSMATSGKDTGIVG
jgi:transposase